MPPTKGKKGSGVGGSRSQSRRGRARASRPTPAVTTRSSAAQAEPSPSSQSGKRSRAADTKGDEVKPSKRAKKAKARSQKDEDAGSASAVSSQADTAADASPTAAPAAQVEEGSAVESPTAAPAAQVEAGSALASPDAAASDSDQVRSPLSHSAPAAQVEEGSAVESPTAAQVEAGSALASPDAAASDSDQVSSPVRRPYLPRTIKYQDADRVVYEPLVSANVIAYHEERDKYKAKLDRQKKLLTLDHSGPFTCLDDESFSDHESAEQMVFQTAKAVLGLSSYTDGKLLARCSGFLIDLDKETGRGIVLTSASLLCMKSQEVNDWKFPRQYAPDAEVLIHLLDDTIEKGKLLNFHKHYNIALFEVFVKISAELPLSPELVGYGQEIFLIGRDETLDLNVGYGRVERVGPGLYDHYHLMYVDCGVAKFGAGGPVIDTKGRVLGMANPTPKSAFIPTPIILKCLRMWRDLKCVPRLHVGLKLSAIKFLHSSHKEKISRKFNIDAGLIVQELEIMLLSICEHCLEKGDGLGSNVDLIVGLFQTRKEKRSTKKLTLNVSDDMEIIAEGTYPVSAEVKKHG